MQGKTRYNVFFIILLFFFIGIRLFGLSQPVFDDETNHVQSINDPGPHYTIKPFQIHKHPPLGGWLFFLTGNLLGQEAWIYRLVPLFLWVINIVLVYLIVSREYSKRAALFSSILMGASYYSVLMSLQIDVEGSLLVTTFLLMAFFYLKYIITKEKKWLVFTGMAFGLALLTKITAVFFLGIIGLHLFLRKARFRKVFCWNNIKNSFLELILVGVVGLLVFSIFPILTWDLFLQMLGHSSNYLGLNISWMALSMLLFWATPLLLGLFLLQVLKFEKKDMFWVIWFLFIFVIYTFLIMGRPGTHGASGGVADYSRHFMNLMVPFSVLGGVFLSRIKINTKQVFGGIVVGIIALVSFFIINLNSVRVLPRDFSVYLNALKSFDFNFLFSFTTSSGNLLGVSIGIIIFSILFSGSLVMFYLLFRYLRQFRLSKWALILFIATGAALNIFLVAEYLGPVTSPDVDSIFYEMVDYVKENEIKQPLHVNDEGLLLHINNFEFEQGENQCNLGKYFEGLDSHEPLQGTVLFLNWSPLSKENIIWDAVKLCTVKKQFFDGGILIGEVRVC
jgi:hypothetical protein